MLWTTGSFAESTIVSPEGRVESEVQLKPGRCDRDLLDKIQEATQPSNGLTVFFASSGGLRVVFPFPLSPQLELDLKLYDSGEKVSVILRSSASFYVSLSLRD